MPSTSLLKFFFSLSVFCDQSRVVKEDTDETLTPCLC
jgi:hypothetical protein